MKIEIEIKKKELEQMVIDRLADKLFEDYKNEEWAFYRIGKDVSNIFEGRAKEILKKDVAFRKKIDDHLRSKLKDEKLIANVAKDIIKERLQEDRY